MKNKMLFLKLMLMFCAINAFKNINSMSDLADFADTVLDENYFGEPDEQSQVRKCIDLIRNYSFEVFEKYFTTHHIDPNLVLELEDNNDEEMDEKHSKGNQESYSEKDNNKTLLMFAVEKSDLRIVEFLIKKGADVTAMTPDGKMSALSIAVLNNDINLTKFLITKGADINDNIEIEFDLNGQTMFIQNIFGLYLVGPIVKLEMVKLLLESYNDFESAVEDNIGRNILEFALENLDFNKTLNKQLIGMLFSRAKEIGIDLVKTNILSMILDSNSTNIMNYLLKMGFISINTEDIDGNNLLCSAAAAGDLKFVELALRLGTDVNFKSNNKDDTVDNSTPLMLACMGSHAHVVIALLNAGADIAIKDRFDRTCFDYLNDEITGDESEDSESVQKESKVDNRETNNIIREILHEWSLMVAKEVMQSTDLPRDISGLVVGMLNDDNLSSQELSAVEKEVNLEEANKKAFIEKQAKRIAERISRGYNKFISKNKSERPIEKEIKNKKRKNRIDNLFD